MHKYIKRHISQKNNVHDKNCFLVYCKYVYRRNLNVLKSRFSLNLYYIDLLNKIWIPLNLSLSNFLNSSRVFIDYRSLPWPYPKGLGSRKEKITHNRQNFDLTVNQKVLFIPGPTSKSVYMDKCLVKRKVNVLASLLCLCVRSYVCVLGFPLKIPLSDI